MMQKTKKMFWINISRRTFFIAVAVILAISFSAVSFTLLAVGQQIPRGKNTVLIDAGHGGRDGGCVGAAGSIEKELNLEYALALKAMLEDFGVYVVMTRKKDAALYSPFSKNKKLDDMRKRISIIDKTKPDLYLSIHMNSTPYLYRQGAIVYHAQNNPASVLLAQTMAETYARHLPNASNVPKKGDFYILDKTQYTGVLIEVGFLSNLEEEKALLTNEYKQKVAYATFCGILLYLGIRLG